MPGRQSLLSAWRNPARHTFAASGAGEPVALAAQVAGGGLRLHSLLDHFAGALHAVGQRHVVVEIQPYEVVHFNALTSTAS
jgi:hypothetical protein